VSQERSTHVTHAPSQELTHETLDRGLRGLKRLGNSAVGALLILAILLGKGLVCQHAPDRAVFFDAMLMVPVCMLAYHEGLVTGLMAGLVAAAADLVITAKVGGATIPVHLAIDGVRTTATARLFGMEVLAGIVSSLSARARREAKEAERRTSAYLKKIRRLEQHSETIERDARHQQEEFEQDLLKYSSLVYLLEESAQKLYSNLEVDRLFQSLFRVLEECFGSTCASVYLKDASSGAYLLAHASGGDAAGDSQIPMMLQPSDLVVKTLETTRQAVPWNEEPYATELAANERLTPAVISGPLLDKGEPMGIVNVHRVDRAAAPDPRLMAIVANIASIALANARLFGEVQWMAERDPLTRLYNRRAFHDQLASMIDRAGQRSEPFALLMLDIDHFKAFNDTYGHQAGDAVLEWFAKHCQEVVGSENLVFRYGGEEFTILMPHTDADAGTKMADAIRSHVEQTAFRFGDADLKVTLSCGVAAFPDHGDDGDELVRKADRAMYRAKAGGRNLVAVTEANHGHDSTIVPYEVKRASEPARNDEEPNAGPTWDGPVV
jgi:diguanylate cyclase (GGDEF)-like protein